MLRDKVTEFFVSVDDFCIEFEQEIKNHLVESKKDGGRIRKAQMADSEIISILILFHYGQFSNFKAFYCHYVCPHLDDLFPSLVSYNRFVELKGRVALPFMLYLKTKGLGKCRGISFIDSTHLKVCHNRRIHQHRTFDGVAERGYCSIGWFYGFKLHLIINDKGEILAFYLTKGNVDDRNTKVMESMTREVFGKLFADKGYISKALSDLLFGNGIQLISKPKKNMKSQNLSQTDKILLRKRALIETVNDELKNICKIQHTRHRSVNNFLINIIAALTAYCFFPKKPSLNIQFEQHSGQMQLAA
uniref:IS982 family transposase n=2 Tax=Roseivirga sp. TaxID=1964215 RepID=UPI004048B8FC